MGHKMGTRLSSGVTVQRGRPFGQTMVSGRSAMTRLALALLALGAVAHAIRFGETGVLARRPAASQCALLV
jgi:hypothetical protein